MVSVGSYRNNISGMSSNDCDGQSSMTGPIKLPHRVYTVENILLPHEMHEKEDFLNLRFVHGLMSKNTKISIFSKNDKFKV